MNSGTLVKSSKGRIVARRFQKVERVDDCEIFAPVIISTATRLLFELVENYELEFH